MSAAVCGSKRSFFEELPPSPPLSKRLRCSSSSSPNRFSAPSLLDHLRSVFPHMDIHILDRALQECGNDLDAAIKSLHELCLGSAEGNSVSAEVSDVDVEKGRLTNDENFVAPDNLSVPNNLPVEGVEWVDLFVREMMSATSMDDAKARAARLLEILEKTISSSAGAEATQNVHKEQIEGLMRENAILKRAVAIQHERQKEYEERNHELQHLKKLVSQYQEQLRTLEVNNYALSMHLKQAQQSSSMPGRFHPDIF
uniref:CUE domain-containing protein n=1 Tax=Fagus sylvatica TaxID=28930 RepID=A0A2N9IJ93_FAGSY